MSTCLSNSSNSILISEKLLTFNRFRILKTFSWDVICARCNIFKLSNQVFQVTFRSYIIKIAYIWSSKILIHVIECRAFTAFEYNFSAIVLSILTSALSVMKVWFFGLSKFLSRRVNNMRSIVTLGNLFGFENSLFYFDTIIRSYRLRNLMNSKR